MGCACPVFVGDYKLCFTTKNYDEWMNEKKKMEYKNVERTKLIFYALIKP